MKKGLLQEQGLLQLLVRAVRQGLQEPVIGTDSEDKEHNAGGSIVALGS